MSGYCLDCGNEMCVCNICECEECSQIPTMTFVSFEAYEKLQADNKTMREALEELIHHFRDYGTTSESFAICMAVNQAVQVLEKLKQKDEAK